MSYKQVFETSLYSVERRCVTKETSKFGVLRGLSLWAAVTALQPTALPADIAASLTHYSFTRPEGKGGQEGNKLEFCLRYHSPEVW